MGRYRKIDVRMWLGGSFSRLSPLQPSGQALWLYLLTNPDTVAVPGLYRCGKAQMSEALGWSAEAFGYAFREAYREGMVEADWRARVIWIPKAIQYDPPQSINVVKAWGPWWSEVPDCRLKRKAHKAIRSHLVGMSDAFRDAFDHAIPYENGEAYATQEQEQEQEQEIPPIPPKGGGSFDGSNGREEPWGPGESSDGIITAPGLAYLWNFIAAQHGCPRVRTFSTHRRRTAKAAAKDEPSVDVWAAAMHAICLDPFLAGKNENGTVHATFDYTLRPAKRDKWLDEARSSTEEVIP